MAKVPTATEMGLGQVKANPANTPYQNFSTNADMFGAAQGRQLQQMGQAMDQAADAMMKIQQEEKKRNDQRSFMEIEERVREYKLNALQGDDGAYNKRGVNALGVTEQNEKNYKTFMEEVMKGREFSSDGRLRAEAYLKEQGFNMSNELYKYERGEEKAYMDGQLEARVRARKDDWINSTTNNPKVLAESISTIKTTLATMADSHGWSQEELKQEIEKEIGDLHIGKIEMLLAQKQGDAAKAYLDKFKDEIDPDKLADITEKTATGEMLSKVQSFVDKHENLESVEDRQKAIAQARDELSGEAEKMAIAEIKMRHTEQAQAKKEKEEEGIKNIYQKLANGDRVADLTTEEYMLLSRNNKVEDALNREKSIAEGKRGHPSISDQGLPEKISQMSDEELLKTDPNQMVSALEVGHYSAYLKRYEAAKQRQKERDEDPLKDTAFNELLLSKVPKTWGLAKTGLGTNTPTMYKEKYNIISDDVAFYVRDYNKEHGRAPKREELSKEIDRLLVNVVLGKGPFGGALGATLEGPMSEINEVDLTHMGLPEMIEDGSLSDATGIQDKDLLATLVHQLVKDKTQVVTIQSIRSYHRHYMKVTGSDGE